MASMGTGPYLICSFTVVGGGRERHQRGPVLQKHLPLAHIAPDPERGQVHSQVVLLCLKKTSHIIVIFTFMTNYHKGENGEEQQLYSWQLYLA